MAVFGEVRSGRGRETRRRSLFAGNPGGATIDLDSTVEVKENVPGGKAKTGTLSAGGIEPKILRTTWGEGRSDGLRIVIEAIPTPPG